MLKIKRFLEYRKCTYCGLEFLTYEVDKINKTDFICHNCQQTHGYTTRNTIYKGKQSNASFSFEFETSSRTEKLYELLKYNFIGCFDGSISGLEWKSPIFYSKKFYSAIFKVFNIGNRIICTSIIYDDYLNIFM